MNNVQQLPIGVFNSTDVGGLSVLKVLQGTISK